MDPEAEGSDVSGIEGESLSFDRPMQIPPAPSKQSLEHQQHIQDRLAELEHYENTNIQRHNKLREKRARMDDRISRKRAAQDAKWRVVMEARARRDMQIKQRREREDIAYQRFYDELEEEETVGVSCRSRLLADIFSG